MGAECKPANHQTAPVPPLPVLAGACKHGDGIGVELFGGNKMDIFGRKRIAELEAKLKSETLGRITMSEQSLMYKHELQRALCMASREKLAREILGGDLANIIECNVDAGTAFAIADEWIACRDAAKVKA